MSLPSTTISRALSLLVLVLAFAGVADATYLTATHYFDTSTICLTADQCDQVLQSSYATLGGIPISLGGFFYYAAVFVLALLYRRGGRLEYWWFLTCLAGLGFLVSGYLAYLQFSVIQAICTYCMLSAGITTLLFLSAGLGIFQASLGRNKPTDSRA